MKVKSRKKSALIFCFFLICFSNGWTQLPKHALILKIEGGKQIQYRPIEGFSKAVWDSVNKKARSPAEIKKLVKMGRLDKAKQGKQLEFDNQVIVDEDYKVQLKYDHRLRAWAYFQSSRKGEKSEFAVIEDPLDTKFIAVYVSNGTALAKVTKGMLGVIVGNLLVTIRSTSETKAVFKVNSDSNGVSTGQIYLVEGKEGGVTFPAYSSFPDSVRKTMRSGRLKRGEIVTFKGDKVTQHIDWDAFKVAAGSFLIVNELTQLVNDFKKLNRPFWQTPKFFIPVLIIGSIPWWPIPEPDLPRPPPLPRDP